MPGGDLPTPPHPTQSAPGETRERACRKPQPNYDCDRLAPGEGRRNRLNGSGHARFRFVAPFITSRPAAATNGQSSASPRRPGGRRAGRLAARPARAADPRARREHERPLAGEARRHVRGREALFAAVCERASRESWRSASGSRTDRGAVMGEDQEPVDRAFCGRTRQLRPPHKSDGRAGELASESWLTVPGSGRGCNRVPGRRSSQYRRSAPSC